MDFKEYQKKMSDKYGDAEELYKQRKVKGLTKEDIIVKEDNFIEVKESVAVHWRNRQPKETKEIEVDGEIYSRVVKKSYIHDVYAFWMPDIEYWATIAEYVFNFELLDLEYKFRECVGVKYQYRMSDSDDINCIRNLFELGVLDKRIIDVRGGKFEFSRYKEKDFINALEIGNIYDIEINLNIYEYGWQNYLYYTISLDTFFKINGKKIKNIEPYYIKMFQDLGLNLLKTSYEDRLSWFKKFERQEGEIERKEILSYNYSYNKPESQCYIIKDENTGLYKIGKSLDPLSREKTLQSEKPTLKAVKIFREDHESELHKLYKKQRVRGEWFKLNNIQLEYVCRNYN
tara:strand:- start:354 stop:1385 length:1032 start_codon:yes stop_codon:yes gene_type:complete